MINDWLETALGTEQEYQNLYHDLSINCDDNTITEKEGKGNMETGKVENAAEYIQAASGADSAKGVALEANASAEEAAPEASGKMSAESAEAILKALEGLQKEFKEKLLVDHHKDQLIDKLHDEVVQYQNGVVNKVVDTMAVDIIQLADNVRKTRAVYSEKEANADNFTKLLRVVNGLYEDLQDILYRQGIEPYTVEGHDVDPRRQTIIASVPTDDESKHNKIAARTAEGYEREDGSVLRRERVKIFGT